MIFKRLISGLRYVESDRYKQPVPKPTDLIVVAMSGGVDSSVCAALYSKEYQNVRGVFMQNWSSESKCSERDWNDVQKVATHLNIQCDRVNFEKDYWQNVFNPMIEAYKKGATPNPDVGCNKYIKFGRLFETLGQKYGTSEEAKWWLVTGHYARVMTNQATNERHLLRGVYAQKDQSFYLSSLPSMAMNRILLPIGHYDKPSIREMAKTFELPTAERPDSQGLCFVSQSGTFRNFLNDYIEPNPGNIVTEDGVVRGKHEGLWHATIGQRAGVCMPQGDPELAGKWFVSEKRLDRNELVIVKGSTHASLYKNNIKAQDWEWLGSMNADQLPPTDELTLQFRSLQGPVKIDSIVINNDGVEVTLKTMEKGIAPGQSLVLYHGDRVLGNGRIVGASKV